MELNCAASCRICDIVLPDNDLCYYVESGPDIWKSGDLDQMFRRIVKDIQHQDPDQYTLEIISSPDITNVTSEDGTTEKGPWIITIDNFLNISEMHRLIELGELQGYRRSTMHDLTLDESYRTSSNSWCSQDSCAQDPIAKNILQRIYDMTQIPEEYSEDMQMLYYQPGQ
jgi:prolyl 4-hydroxylase